MTASDLTEWATLSSSDKNSAVQYTTQCGECHSFEPVEVTDSEEAKLRFINNDSMTTVIWEPETVSETLPLQEPPALHRHHP